MNSDPTTLAPINTSNLFPRAQTTPLTQMIDEISFSISSLDTDIAQIQATLAGLRKSRQELITRLKALKAASALNPVYRLPVEILLTIFGICVDEDIKPDREMASGSQFDGFPPLSLNTTKAPWVLGQVCRRWKDVALSTPDLWKVVDVNWNGTRGLKGRSHTFMANLLSLRLQRAKNQPLSVSLNCFSCRRRIPPLLFSKCSHWVNLTVYIPFELHFGFKSYCGMLHNLSTLHLHLEMRLHNDLLFGVHNAPNLRTLTLSGNYDFFLSLQTQIPWNQITHFTTKDLQFYDYIDPPPTAFYLDILPLLANVQECSLEIPHHPHWGQWRPGLTLAHLRNLTFTKPLRPVALSDHLILPALRRLCFDNVRTYGVRDTIIRFSAMLQELIFDGYESSRFRSLAQLGMFAKPAHTQDSTVYPN
ncbi:hypothetical protein L218DRAFT_964230 [Marasmius fiardii PR-910]|nr:hypothetical protein L218DRAFT_964230 [Marasmius fiardii PR-910]